VPPVHPAVADEDTLAELPPLDGGDDDVATPDPEDFEGEDVKSGEGDMDDSTGAADPADFLPDSLDAAPGDAMADAEESRELDVGAIDLLGDENESLLADNDELGTENETLDIEENDEGARDAGEEGPTQEDDGHSLGELPPMDADDEGAMEDDAFFDGLADEIPAPWADDAWEKIAEHGDPAAIEAELGPLLAAGVTLDASRLGPGMSTVRATAELPGFLACARVKPGQDASLVFLFSPETGARTIAELGTPDAHEISRLAFDPATGTLWVVGEFGVVGLRKPHR
jgi:hypothetical protein